MAGTRPRRIIKVEEEIPKIIHEIDQFYWYRDAMKRTFDGYKEEDAMKLISLVRFDLPWHPGTESPSYLLVVGDSLRIANVYLARVRGRDLLTGNIPPQKSNLQKLFSYSERQKHSSLSEYEKEIEPLLPIELFRIFTTDISPFLKGGDYPLECDRIYEIQLYGFNKIRVVAKNRKNREEQKLEIVWVPDKRDGNEELIETLMHQNGCWTSESLESKASTFQFTFSNTVNTDSL